MFPSAPTHHFLISPQWLFEELAGILAIPLQILFAATYLPGLIHIYNLSKFPHSMLLNSSFSFQFCPACARNRMLMLAHITFCPLHHVMLCLQCPCGAPQRLFCRRAQPFAFNKCGLDWAHFPQFGVSLEEIEQGDKLLKWYETFFSRGTPRLFSEALKLIHRNFPGEGVRSVKLLDGKTRPALPDARSRISLGDMMDWLVSLNLSPADLTMEIDIFAF